MGRFANDFGVKSLNSINYQIYFFAENGLFCIENHIYLTVFQ